jgi:hypothetical protein
MKKILVLMMILPLAMGLALQPTAASGETSITTYVVPAITDTRILPTTTVSAGLVSSIISVAACRGEYEPASFVVRANEEISTLTVEATDLAGPSTSIPSSSIDIRVVKCWYVAGTTMPYVGTRTLVPELLLKDDTLVKVENGENYVKLTTGEYVWISNTTDNSTQYPSIASMPIKDSSTLLPVDIPIGTNKQFWITVHVPESAASGTYVGSINLSTAADGLVSQMSLELEVLSFDLQPSMLTYHVDYLGILKTQGSISFYGKNTEQYQAELADIAAHSGDATLSQPVYFSETTSVKTFKNALSLRNQKGVNNTEVLYGVSIEYLGWSPSDPTNVTALTAKVQSIVNTAKEYGVTTVYFEGQDEKQGAALANQRPAWEAIRSVAGAKMWVCGHRAGAGADEGEDNFSVMGDIQDLFVCARAPNAAEAARWHSVGHKIWCYSYPMSGGEVPNTYRRNYGLLLWQRGYDGGLAIYQWKSGFIWNDFDDPYNWKGHTFAYPTVNGVIDTTEWEGWREARDDTRYLATLLDAIETAKAAGKDTTAAETWVASLKSSDLTTKNLGTVRSEMVDHIASLAVYNASQPGDANADGNVNTADLTLVERIIAGLDTATAGADANLDGYINTADITRLEQIIGG